jgi:TP901-1 family phage major tail protein
MKMPDTVANEIKYLQGVDTVAFFRQLSKAGREQGRLMPWQTSLSFDPQRNSDTNPTKDGMVSTTSSVETDFEVEFTNNTSALADLMYDSLFDGEKLEAWIVYRNRRNNEGKYFAWYMHVFVSEDSNDNDPDDNSNRDVTFSVDGTPKRGWLTLPSDAQAEIDYIFRGIEPVTDGNATGGGTAWDKDKDPGTNVEQPDATDQLVAVTGVTVDPTAADVQVGNTVKLNATVAPDNATDKTVTWSTSDTKLATVGADGTVTGVAVGSPIITATAGGKTATATITVTAGE